MTGENEVEFEIGDKMRETKRSVFQSQGSSDPKKSEHFSESRENHSLSTQTISLLEINENRKRGGEMRQPAESPCEAKSTKNGVFRSGRLDNGCAKVSDNKSARTDEYVK